MDDFQYYVSLDKDAYILLLKLVLSFNTESISDALKLCFDEINKISPCDSLFHINSVPNEIIEEVFSDVL